MDQEAVRCAIVQTAERILAEAGIEVDEKAGVISWPDPNEIPIGPRPISYAALMELGRCVKSARLCWPTSAYAL
jgi:hypothetical protein